MTAQDLKNSILQLAVQGKLVSQRKTEASVDLSGLKQKKTNECEFDIPNSWRFAHLETITRGVPSKQYQILESEVKQDGRFPVISQSKAYSIGFTDSEEKLYRHEDPVVIFGDHTTEIKFVDFDFVVGADGVKIFKPITSVITAKFLFYVLQFYSRDLHKVGGYSRHYKFIKNNPIPLPPLAEQERIVAKIKELLPLVSEYDEVENRISALNTEFPDKLRKSILQQAVQGKLTERDPSDEPAIELLDCIRAEKAELISEGKINKERKLSPISDDEIPFELPDKWQWVRFSELMHGISTGPFGSMLHKEDYVPEGIPVVNPANIINGGIIPLQSMMISEITAQRLSSYRLTTGMIVMGRRGEMGRCAIVGEAENGWLCGTGSFFMTPSPFVYSLYLILFFASPYAKNYLGGASIGETMNNLNHNILKSIPVPLPPFAEQQRIVKRVEELLAACKAL
mgnify:FL=1